MPSLIDLPRRIRAVKSTQQITKAMKMIAASRLKRAQDRVIAARPFAQRMLKVLNGLVSRVDQEAHPLLRIPPQGSGRPLLIVITADRGLCGSFNSNVIKAAGQFILNEAPGRDIALGLVGRKGRDFFRRRGFDVRYETVGIFQKMTFADAIDIADAAIEDFSSGAASSVYLVYNEFKSVMTQRIVVERLLPIPRLEGDAAPQERSGAGPTVDYLYEPAPEEIFRDLLPRHVQIQVYRALLESNAAFFAAQMTAMDAASRNSTDMIENLTLYMNKVRQAAITREIIEVVSGAAAT
jgi:F-type H+-transporting ATPase subunit gamma